MNELLYLRLLAIVSSIATSYFGYLAFFDILFFFYLCILKHQAIIFCGNLTFFQCYGESGLSYGSCHLFLLCGLPLYTLGLTSMGYQQENHVMSKEVFKNVKESHFFM